MSTSLDTSRPTGDAARWDRFRERLLSQRAECVQQRAEALEECAQSVPDPVAQRLSADLQRTIEEIDAALARIDVGSYGRCAHCGTEIPEERLELRPFTDSCVRCTGTR